MSNISWLCRSLTDIHSNEHKAKRRLLVTASSELSRPNVCQSKYVSWKTGQTVSHQRMRNYIPTMRITNV